MKTNLTLALDLRRKKSDNTYPIILRLSHLRKTTSISLGYSVEERDWDSRKRNVRNSYKGVTSVNKLNNILLKEKTRAADIINDLFDKKELEFLSIKQVKDKIVRTSKYESFFEFGYGLADNLKKSQRYGTARSYIGTLGTFKTYNNNKDLKFNELNYDFLLKYESQYLSRGNSINGLASNLRTIKAIYNKAIRAGLVKKEAYPFTNYKIRTIPTKKRAIDLESIKKIVVMRLDRSSALFHYRNYFLASYMMYGISFMDLAFLKLENIINGRIRFQRSKTGKLYDIKITEQLQEILSIYTKNKEKDKHIFPIIKRDKLELQHKDIDWERHRYNKGLKRIAALCNIEDNLTSYVSRHSFATQAMLQNVPLLAISAMLGHSKLNTTQIYLKSLPNNILDTYNEQIISF
jgi:site-specific recombinase XerD